MAEKSSEKYNLEFQEKESQDHKGKKHNNRIVVIVVVILVVVLLAIIIGLAVGLSLQSKNEAAEKEYNYDTAAVATDAAECSIIGSDILEKGGSAVDAAIASLLCLGLVTPQSTGIGGGYFMTVYDPESSTSVVFNAREEAPTAVTQDLFVDNWDAAVTGALAICIPGEIRGMWSAHQKYGKLSWEELFEPSIELAENGFSVGYHLARALTLTDYDLINGSSHLSALFLDTDMNLLEYGDTVKNPALAETYRRISTGGVDEFYLNTGTGSLAQEIIADITDEGGIMTLNDLMSYKAKESESVETSIGDWTLYSPPAPGSGPVLSLILNTLEGFNYNEKSLSSEKEATLTYYQIAETFKYAYADRSLLGDPSYTDISTITDAMVTESYAALLQESISASTATSEKEFYLDGDRLQTSGGVSGTSHVSIIDSKGIAVSVTSSVNYYFGSKVVGSRTGIVFNNHMDDFLYPTTQEESDAYTLDPPANLIGAGKRPQSSTCPSVFVDQDGNAALSVGAAGGKRITTATALAAANVIWFEDKLSEAIERTRIHHQLDPNQLEYEDYTYEGMGDKHFSEGIATNLEGYGHEVLASPGFAVVNGVLREEDGTLSAWSDSRKGGLPAGF